jgi:alkylhydroperoxidase family enzyme
VIVIAADRRLSEWHGFTFLTPRRRSRNDLIATASARWDGRANDQGRVQPDRADQRLRSLCADHASLDDEVFATLRASFSDAEILDLTLCIAVFLGLGRTLSVLGVDQSCAIDI